MRSPDAAAQREKGATAWLRPTRFDLRSSKNPICSEKLNGGRWNIACRIQRQGVERFVMNSYKHGVVLILVTAAVLLRDGRVAFGREAGQGPAGGFAEVVARTVSAVVNI